ncbi:hypothetical protein C8F01DRAFT_1208022 [Mycena amicta]|nr:hypothetical protein C8F01DRAFT_1208022 [Mycena amicta]
MDPHPLKTLLQLQLGSDSSAVLHLPYTLASLTAASLLPSSHSSKWTARINSLLHAKTSDARWAGLCLAHKSALLSQAMMIECAQSWIGVALPLLSVPVCLLRVIFSAATDMHEFQRQVLILSTLTRLIPIYPTLHRASQPALSALSFAFLNGNPFKPPNQKLTSAASQLYAVLHLTGGKVGAANLWRKSVDDTLAFGWTSFSSLRTSFPVEGSFHPCSVYLAQLLQGRLPQPPADSNEPLTSIPLNLDRLRCCIVVLANLFRATVHRPVQVPLGALVKLSLALLTCKRAEKTDEHIDTTVRSMESMVTPQIWALACQLISSLANSFGSNLTCHIPRLVTCIAFQLEQDLTSYVSIAVSSERLPFLDALQDLLSQGHTLHSTVVVNRLAKAVLPLATVVLARQTDARTNDADTARRSKKGKKRARDFEGDEVFKISREVICPTMQDGHVLLRAFAVLRLLLRTSNLSPALQSIVCRVSLSVLLALPQMTPASLSPDLGLHALLLDTIEELCVEFASASVEGMSKSLGLIVGACLAEGKLNREMETLLHPRLPPLMRSVPGVEALSLYRAEESQEETDLLKSLGLVSADSPSIEEPAADIVLESPPPPTVQRPMPQPVQPPITPPSKNLETVLPPPQSSLPKIAPAPIATPVDVPMDVEDTEKNEEMPEIDLDSDSEAE